MRLASNVGVLTTALASALALAACGTASGASGTAPPTVQQVVQASSAPSSTHPAPGFHTAGYPGVFFKGRGTPLVIDSTLS